MKIEPLKDKLGADVKVDAWWNISHDSYAERSKMLNEQLAMRPKVWGVGLWPDEESEKIAKECAGQFMAIWGLPDTLIPDDSLELLAEYGGEDFDLTISSLERLYACEIDGRELKSKNASTLGGLVAQIKARKGTKPPKPEPKGWYRFFLEWIWPVLKPIAALAALIIGALLLKSCGS